MTLPTRNSQLALRRADFRTVPEMLDYAAEGETGVTFYSVRGEILSASSWREIRERAHVTARRLIGAGFAPGERILITADTWPGFFDSFFGAQYAGLLPVPVSVPVGIGGKDAYLDQLRRQLAASGAVAAVGIEDLAGFLADAAAEFPAVRLHGGMSVIEALPEKPVDLRPLGPSRPLLHPVLLGQHAPSARRADHPGRADGQPRRHHRAGRPRSRAGRSRGELAAALSRHGPDRLPDGAALDAALARLPDAARLRAPADAVAEPDLAAIAAPSPTARASATTSPRAAPPARCRPISTCRAGAMPASAAT